MKAILYQLDRETMQALYPESRLFDGYEMRKRLSPEQFEGGSLKMDAYRIALDMDTTHALFHEFNRCTSDEARLETLFDLFNHPHMAQIVRNRLAFRGRSMSVGDVVCLQDEAGERFYYCDNVGWERIMVVMVPQK